MMIPDGAIASGVISKIINDLADVSKSKIKKAVEDKKNKHKSLESQLYNLIVSLLKEMNDNSYDKNSDKIYDTAEKLLKGFIEYGREDEEAVKYALKNILPCVDDDKCMEFKRLLIHEISKEEYNELYREIRLLQEEKEYRKTDRIERKVDHLDQKLDDIRKNDERIIRNIDKAEKFQNNKKQDYIDNWNSRLFLHIDNDERPLTLADAFIMPSYKKIVKSSSYIDDTFGKYEKDIEIDFSSVGTFDKVIEKFVKYNKTSTMLILGVPGIGKSTITSWIANKYRNDDRFIVLRFRDWEREDLEHGLLKAIYSILECKRIDLECKILVLDGFDEMKLLDKGDYIITSFVSSIKDFKNFKCIITSRPAYINIEFFQHVFELKEFDINKVEIFYEKITGECLENKENIELNIEVYGIPVILYMAIISKADMNEKTTIPKLYSRIFAAKGGLFDKFCEYDNGEHVLRNPTNIKKFLNFLCETAFKMFKRNILQLKKEECEIPELDIEKNKVSILEFPIKHLFECTEENIEFVHTSIYEYFVSEYIFIKMDNIIIKDKNITILAKFFSGLLGSDILSSEIFDFLRYKVKNSNLKNNSVVNAAFQIMLQDGMTFYTGECYKNAMDQEMNVFANMLEIIHFWDCKDLKFDFLFRYIKRNLNLILNLSGFQFHDVVTRQGANLMEANLKDAYLKKAYLRSAILKKANLVRVNLKGADLMQANLSDANLSKANLRETDFMIAKLRGADLSDADLRGADLRGADLSNADLRGAKLDYSIWNKDDIQESISQLREADFECILLSGSITNEKMNRKELFADGE